MRLQYYKKDKNVGIMKLDSRYMKLIGVRILKFVRNFIIFFFVSSILFVLLYRWVPVPITPLMVIRTTEQLFSDGDVRILKDWTPINSISPNMVRAVIASEDNKFLSHSGFDWEAIEKAREMNKKGKKLVGASTISQQVAKNVFLYPKRSYFRKGLEAYFTFLIEKMWSKERIMEVYLNVLETGHGIYGVEKASRIYFHKSAKDLTQSEAALIAASLPNPLKMNPQKPSNYMTRRQSTIMRVMRQLGKIDLSEESKK